MATLGNNNITGLNEDQVTSNDHVVTRSYSDGLLPSPQDNSGGLLKKVDVSAGLSWTAGSIPINSKANLSWAHQDLFLGVGYCFSKDVYASTDLVNWSARTVPASTNQCSDWSTAGWANGYWFLIGGYFLGVSTDSITWQVRTSGAASGGYCPGYSDRSNGVPQVFYKDPYWYTGTWSQDLWASTDTIVWQRRSHNNSTTYSYGQYCEYALMGGSSGRVNATTDWYHWKQRTTTICNDTIGLQTAGDYLFGFGQSICTVGGSPYPVSLHMSTDTIHWVCRDTGYRSYCNDANRHPTSVAYFRNKYYTAFQMGGGSGNCCGVMIISSTDTVVWETEAAACSVTGLGECWNWCRVIPWDNGVVIGSCFNNCSGLVFAEGGAANKKWENISNNDDRHQVNVSQRGSCTLTADNCPFFNFSFPKETQYVSLEIQSAGNVATMCASCDASQNGGRGGDYYHLLYNKCDLGLPANNGLGDKNSTFTMNISGSTLAPNGFNSAFSGLVGSDDLEHFYLNRAAWAAGNCYYACQMCDVSSGFDANKNEVILLANSPVVSSLDGGRTWERRTTGQCNNPWQTLYIDGCRGNFWGAFCQRICHSTDTIHWSCKQQCPAAHGCYICHLSYQQSAIWALGCRFLSCSTDGGNTWCRRTTFSCDCACSFAYDSSGGYLIGYRNGLASSTDSIHWKPRTSALCYVSGFRYCNSKWYAFGGLMHYGGSGNKSDTWAIMSSTDSISWESECCLHLCGDAKALDSEYSRVEQCSIGPNNETILLVRQSVNKYTEQYQNRGCQYGSYYGGTYTLNSTTDFIHWTDLTEKTPYSKDIWDMGQQSLCYACVKSINYSSDTGRFFMSGCGNLSCLNVCQTSCVGWSGACLNITFSLKDSCSGLEYFPMTGGCPYRTVRSGNCPLYQCGCNQSSNAQYNSKFTQRYVSGGDPANIDPNAPGLPGVTCSTRQDLGRSQCWFDYGLSGASSGGTSSGFGPGGGVCSPLGNIPATDIDTSELKEYNITVTANGSSNYGLAGEDRGGTFSATSNKSLTVKSGDLIVFTLDNSVSGHPFWIKNANSTGDEDRVLAKFVKNNGADSGEILLDTFKMKPGTYHYNCEHHSGMHGTITVEEAVVNLDGENGIGNNYSLFGTGGAAGYTFRSGFMNWFRRTQAAFQAAYVHCDTTTRVFYGNGTWLHAAGRGIATSTDTINWTLRTVGIPGEGTRCGRAVYGNSTWFLDSYQTGAASSTDAIHWTRRTTAMGSCECAVTGMAYGNNMFLVKSCEYMIASTDAIHWKLRTAGVTEGGSSTANEVAFGDGLFAYVNRGYSKPLRVSTDTIHWQSRTHNLLDWYMYDVDYANGYWFIHGESCMSISTDSIHWNNRACNSSTTTKFSPLVYSAGYYIWGGVNGCLYYRKTIDPSYTACNCFTRVDDPFNDNDDIKGAAVSDSGALMMSDGQGIYAMDSRRTRMLGGDGGDGCNGGGAGAGSMVCDADNAWATTGTNGRPGDKKIRISWW